MPTPVTLRDGLPALLEAAAQSLPARGLGVLQREGAEHVLMTYLDAFGLAAYRYPVESVPASLRPPLAGPRRVEAAEISGRIGGPLVGDAAAVPLDGWQPPALLLVGLGVAESGTADPLPALQALAGPARELLEQPESKAAELLRLRRLEAIDLLLPELFQALDVRWVFDWRSARRHERCGPTASPVLRIH